MLDPRDHLSRRLFVTATLATLAGCGQPQRGRAAPALEPPLAVPVPAPAQPEPPSAPVADLAPRQEADLPLFQAHPALRDRLPRVPLGQFPTPVEHAADLGARLGIGSLWVKRDDRSAQAYGGGKVRKLEFLLGEAKQRGARTVITSGGVGSNHAVATAIFAAQQGMHAVLALLPEPPDDRVRRNLLADVGAGAEIRIARGRAQPEAMARRLATSGEGAPYVIATGGSSPLGNVGFVNAAFELAGQIERGEMPAPDVIYLAMGTMGSAVGLALGLRAAGLATRVVAVRASSPGTSSEARMQAMAAETEAFLRGLDPSFPASELRSGDVVIDAGHLGAGYGRETRKGRLAMEMAEEHAGLSLDPVYTSKALSALIDDAAGLSRKIVLFWNSHHGRKLDLRGVDPRSLPREIAGYFAGWRGPAD